MNKFKKVMLGALSVLTLGLFAVVGTKVDAADEGVNYYYWKNSSEAKLLGDDGTTKISISNASPNTSFASRSLTITDTIIPGKQNCSNSDSKLVVAKDYATATFTMTSNFYFNMNTFYDSADAASIKIMKGTAEYKVFTSVKQSSKCNYLLQYSDPFPAGTYSITGKKAQYITELYFPLAGDIYYVTYNTDYESVESQYAENWNSSSLPTLKHTGQSFGGWYYDSEFNSPATIGDIDSSKASNGNISLYAKWTEASTCTISYSLNGGTNEANAPTSANLNSEITLPTPTKAGYVFTGWNTESDSTLRAAGLTYTISGNVTLVANWREATYGDVKTAVVDDLGYSAGSSCNGIEDGTVFGFYNLPIETKSSNGYSLAFKMNNISSPTVTSGAVVPNRMISINVTASYGATVTVMTRTSSNGDARTLRICDSKGNVVSTNLTTTDGSNYSATKFYIETAGVYYLYAYSGNTYVSKISIADNSNIRVMQQEATGQTIGENAATYIRFVAIIKDEDVSSTDFVFKIYRTKDDTTEYITRSVSTYSSLKLNGDDYSVTLPSGVSTHTFNGNSGKEVYAVYVVGFTNSTYSKYTISAGFTYKGVEYKTEGYTFA